ncbi:MAG TPA: hypothetical protein VF832_16465 [Longimicrobiales bacterium]
MKAQTEYSAFNSLDIRVGRIVSAEPAATRKPTYRITVDFGAEIGTRVSCGGYTHYPAESLVGRMVAAVMNLGTKRMGPEISEILILGANNERGETILLEPEGEVPLGAQVL